MTYVIGEPCVDVLDRACVEECPVDCIYEGDRMLYIHPDECVDCGACEPVCPVEAIYYEDDLPDQWKAYTEENARFFAEPLLAVTSRSARREAPPGSAWWAPTPRSSPLSRHGNSPGETASDGTARPVLFETGRSAADPEEAAMTVTIYGDFNCPYSYLASQRADLLGRAGTEVDWRAVEHDLGLPVTGSRSDSDRAAWDRELTEVAALALPGEHAPAGPPVLISNTKAAVAACAEAVSDGVAGELRRRLFRAIWVQGLHLSSAYEVRRLVTGLMWPQEDISDRLASPDIPSLLLRDPDLARIVRRSGGTIAPDGGPLTTAGWRRIGRWRQEWLALPSQVIPAVIGPDQVLRPGIEGLGYLVDLCSAAGLRPRLPLPAEGAPGRDVRPAAIARAA